MQILLAQDLHVERLDQALVDRHGESLAGRWLSPRSGQQARARPTSFRPTTTLDERETRILVEQTTVVDPQRLGRSAGRLETSELRAVDEALALILGL